MTKPYKLIVFVGRFQPVHKSHIEIINRALHLSERVLVLIGSSNQPRTIKNPWTWQERERMIQQGLFDQPFTDSQVFFEPLNDYIYNDQTWATQVQDVVAQYCDDNTNIGIIGHSKDESSYYLKMFPQWKFVDVENIDDLHATDIRSMMLELQQIDNNMLPGRVGDYIRAFMLTSDFDTLVEEYKFIQKYRQSWSKAPYAPTFVTADAVVVQSGHVLLVRRRAQPGRNLFATPGGFVNQNETLEDAALRELREETKLKVPLPVLKGNIKSSKVFDAPARSLRGRTITQAFYIELPPGELPKVRGSDDADKAVWVPLNVFEKMQDQMFEDHWHIVQHFIG